MNLWINSQHPNLQQKRKNGYKCDKKKSKILVYFIYNIENENINVIAWNKGGHQPSSHRKSSNWTHKMNFGCVSMG